MKISETAVVVTLTDNGGEVLGKADGLLERAGLPQAGARVALDVKESDEAGLWAHATIAGAKYLLLIRWEHVLSVEFPEPKLRLRRPAR